MRTKNHLTQKQFADRLNVTSQAVSKWENARGIPDIDLLRKISEEFKCDISDIINGKEKNKPKKYIYPFFSTILLGIIIVAILSKGNTDFKFLNLSSKNNSFNIKGVAVFTNDKKSIYISNIEYINEKNMNDKYIVMECSLFEKVNDTQKKIDQCGDITSYDEEEANNPQTLSQFLKTVEFKVDNYASTCKTLEEHNLFISINALDTDNKVISYQIPINLEENCSK